MQTPLWLTNPSTTSSVLSKAKSLSAPPSQPPSLARQPKLPQRHPSSPKGSPAPPPPKAPSHKATQPQQQPHRNSPTLPPSVTPPRLRCACGKFYADYAQFQSGTHFKACHLKSKSPCRCFPKHNLLETDPLPFDAPFIAVAKASFSAHPRLQMTKYIMQMEITITGTPLYSQH